MRILERTKRTKRMKWMIEMAALLLAVMLLPATIIACGSSPEPTGLDPVEQIATKAPAQAPLERATAPKPRVVTSHDFKWSFERAADPKTLSPTADTYLGDIVGVLEKLSGKAKEVAGVRVVDDYTLEVTIKEPISYFLDKMTYATGFVLDRETVGTMSLRDAFQVKANGTGPFRLAEYVPDQKLVLERSKDYYRARQGNVEKFVFEAGGSPMTGYENDEVWMTNVSVVDWERVTDPKNPLSKEFHKVPKLSFGYVGFNVAMPPFDDLSVRKAFAMAIDNALIVTAITKGMTPPATGILPPGMPGYDPNQKVWGFNKDGARALLQESKYYNQLTAGNMVVKFTVAGAGSEPSPFEAAMIQMLEQNLGIKPVFETMEWATFLGKYDSKELQMFSLGWVADYPDPQNFLEVLFHSKSAQNRFNYANAQVDALLDQARGEKNRDARMALYRKAETLIAQDVPVIPTTFGVDYYLAKPWLSGFDLSAGIVPFLKDVSVDPKRGKTVPFPIGEPYGGGGSIPTLDPHKAGDVNSSQYLQEIYSGLVTFNPATLEVVPDIAESWEVSADGLIYTFHLRKNVTFHYGR